MAGRFVVIGSGAWGTTIAMLLAEKADHHVTLWSYRPEQTDDLRRTRENNRVLPGVRIPESVAFESDFLKATDQADMWIAAVPTVYLRATLSTKSHKPPP